MSGEQGSKAAVYGEGDEKWVPICTKGAFLVSELAFGRKAFGGWWNCQPGSRAFWGLGAEPIPSQRDGASSWPHDFNGTRGERHRGGALGASCWNGGGGVAHSSASTSVKGSPRRSLWELQSASPTLSPCMSQDCSLQVPQLH